MERALDPNNMRSAKKDAARRQTTGGGAQDCETGIAFIGHGCVDIRRAIGEVADSFDLWRQLPFYAPRDMPAVEDPKLTSARVVILGFSMIRRFARDDETGARATFDGRAKEECLLAIRLRKPVVIVFDGDVFDEADVRRDHSEYPYLHRILAVPLGSIYRPDFHDKVANLVNAMTHAIEIGPLPPLIATNYPRRIPTAPMIIKATVDIDGTKLYFRSDGVGVERFTVTVVRIDVPFTRVIFGEGSDSPLVVIGLMFGARYAFSIFGRNDAGDGQPSAIFEYSMPRTLQPVSSCAHPGLKRVIRGYNASNRGDPPTPGLSAKPTCPVQIISHEDAQPFVTQLKAILRERGMVVLESTHSQDGAPDASGPTETADPSTAHGGFESLPITVAIISPGLLASSRTATRMAAAGVTALHNNQEKRFLPCYISMTAAQLYDFCDPPRDPNQKEMLPMSKPPGITHRTWKGLLPRRGNLPPGPWEEIFSPLRQRPGYANLPVQRLFLATINKFTGLHYASNEVPAKPRYPSEKAYLTDICALVANFIGLPKETRPTTSRHHAERPPPAGAAAPPPLARPSVAPRNIASVQTSMSTASTAMMTMTGTTSTVDCLSETGNSVSVVTKTPVLPTITAATGLSLAVALATNFSQSGVIPPVAKILPPPTFASPSTPMQVGGIAKSLSPDCITEQQFFPLAATLPTQRTAAPAQNAVVAMDIAPNRLTSQVGVCYRSSGSPGRISVTFGQEIGELVDNATFGDLRKYLLTAGYSGDLFVNSIRVHPVDNHQPLTSMVAEGGVFRVEKNAAPLTYSSALPYNFGLPYCPNTPSASCGRVHGTAGSPSPTVESLRADQRARVDAFMTQARSHTGFPEFPKECREMAPPGPISQTEIESAAPIRHVAYVAHMYAWTLAESAHDAIVALPGHWPNEPMGFSCGNFVMTPQDVQTTIRSIKGSRICLLITGPVMHPRVLVQGLLAVACEVPVVVLFDGDLYRTQDFEALRFENPEFFLFPARPLYMRFRASTVSIITDAILTAFREGAGVPWALRKVIDPADKMMVTMMGILNRRGVLDLHSGIMDELVSAVVPDKYDLDPMPMKVLNLREGTDDQVADAARYLRDSLGHENAEHRAAVRDSMLACGAVSPLIRTLGRTAGTRAVQYNLACALTNFCSGDAKHVQAVYEAKGLELLVQLLGQPGGPVGEPDVREMVPWNLTNIAGESIDHRDEIVRLDTLALTSVIVMGPTRPSDDVCREVAGLFYALHRPKPLPPWSESKKCLPAIVVLLEGTTDVDTAQRCLWTLAEFGLQPPPDAWEMLLTVSVLRVVARMLMVRDERVTIPAARVCGRLACGNAAQTGKLLDPQYHLLRHLRVMMGGSEKERMESIWAVSNVLAEAPGEHVQCVVNEDITPILVSALASPVEKIRQEAVCCLANLTRHGTDDHARVVQAERSVTEYLCRLFEVVPESAAGSLTEDHEAMVSDALDVLIAFLRVAELNKDAGFPHAPHNICARAMQDLDAHSRLANLAKRATPLGDRAGRVVAFYFKKKACGQT